MINEKLLENKIENVYGTAQNKTYSQEYTNTLNGLLSNLNTTDKSNIVNAINEVLGSIPHMVDQYESSLFDGYSCDYINDTIPTMANSNGTSTTNGYSQSYINNLLLYSTTEHRVGTWVDGKPIYRTVIIKENPNMNRTTHGIKNIDTVTGATGIAKIATGAYQQIPRALTNWDICIGDVDATQYTFQYDSGYAGGYAITKVWLIFEYTKTTD